jgi:hypothetical protein
MTAIFFELNLPTLTTILHNTKHKFRQSVIRHDNALVRYISNVCNAELVC